MRLFAVGDIHGCGTALEVILTAINLQPGDKLVSLGDYINKGPESKWVLEQLIQLYDQDFLVPLLGNHECKLLTAGKLRQTTVGQTVLLDNQMIAAYTDATNDDVLAAIPERHWRFVQEACLKWYTTDDYIFVHAMLEPQKSLAEQTETTLFWDKLVYPQPHQSGKIMVCGHTPQRDGCPLNMGYAICLDTAACEGQWLTCLELHSGEVWQANQQRQLRKSQISDYWRPLRSVKGARDREPVVADLLAASV